MPVVSFFREDRLWRPILSPLVRTALIEELEQLRQAVHELAVPLSEPALSAEQLAAPHPHTAFGSVLKALVHLVAHVALHRGQMRYLEKTREERMMESWPSQRYSSRTG